MSQCPLSPSAICLASPGDCVLSLGSGRCEARYQCCRAAPVSRPMSRRWWTSWSFCSSSEQTYEGFLSSFTHLPAGGAADGQLDLASGLSPCQTAGGMENGVETDMEEGEWLGDKCLHELVLDKGVTVGGCVTGERPPGGVKFDNYLDILDFSHEEEYLSLNSDQMALPGEVEEGLPFTASICHHTMLEFHTVALNQDQGQRSTPGGQEEPEEVQPFTLDENFDYDHAMLSQKHPVL